ncbi:alpha/beta fold hydrolase [Streptomyces sp. TRM70350]|uniref:alpha/beta fold hydrolase n=1 Tax=Streptomyces sp. TRM70350 TaxID=2856165 RepID=UPI001C44AE99|nr:alpha/beta hydrolase [Streptomyces sp. TRM70350]MBV7699345.1 alpha/beta hydrolase [Streptomyces sp. TRM70350]
MTNKSTRRLILTGGALLAAAASGTALTFASSGAAGAAGGAPRLDSRTTTAQHSSGGRPTIVLVHGAFADSSSWNDVVAPLKQAGYPVVAAANPLRGLHQDAASVRSVLDSIDGPIVLAGHSYGGSVISEAAADHPQVKALVYIAAFQPDKGESSAELAGKFPGSTLGPNLNPVPFRQADGSTGTDLYIKQKAFHSQFAADVPRRTTDLMAATQRPITDAALNDTATEAAWKTIPSWALTTTQDLNIPIAAQRFMADRAGSHTREVKASHAVTVSQPQAVARLIKQADHATR